MERHWTLYFARSVRKVVRLKWQIPPSLAQQTICIFLMVSNQREHFSYSLFYFGCKYKEGEAFKVFKSPYLKGFLGPSSCLSLSTVVDSHLLCSMRQKSFSYNFLLQKFVSFSPKNGNHQQNTKIHSVAQTDLKRNLTFMK